MDVKVSFGRYRKQRGLSLIELMIAMVIGVVLLGGIIQTMLASKEASATQQSISTITDNARFLFDFMARDLRMAGRGYCNEGEGAAFPDGCADAKWPDDASGNPILPVELTGGVLYVRYETFADADDDGDTEEVFVEVQYNLDGDTVDYSRRMSDDITDDKFDITGTNLEGYGAEPLVSGVSGLGYEFARYDADGTYGFYPGTGVLDWHRVTAIRTQVTFEDVDAWGEGLPDKTISFTVAMRNQVSRWIP